MIEKLNKFITNSANFLVGILKICLWSRKPFKRRERRDDTLLILGNGPSLRDTIDTGIPSDLASIAVNFAANAPEFKALKPRYYILADPHFFIGEATDKNVASLWKNLSDASWNMTLFIPHKYKKYAQSKNLKHKIEYFNLTPIDGWKWFAHAAYRSGLGMPRPRNVLIPAIMVGERLGFSRILIAGADHSWTKTLSVDNDNNVVSIQPHFYSDNKEETARVSHVYKGFHIYQILESMSIAFRSYFQIADYMKAKKINIVNITPGSFIDAFPRADFLTILTK
jgi:hypothetical protein